MTAVDSKIVLVKNILVEVKVWCSSIDCSKCRYCSQAVRIVRELDNFSKNEVYS